MKTEVTENDLDVEELIGTCEDLKCTYSPSSTNLTLRGLVLDSKSSGALYLQLCYPLWELGIFRIAMRAAYVSSTNFSYNRLPWANTITNLLLSRMEMR